MSPTLNLTVTPKNQSVICDIDYSGSSPSEYLIFYYQQGSKVVKSMSSDNATNITISNLINGTTYFFMHVFICHLIPLELKLWNQAE